MKRMLVSAFAVMGLLFTATLSQAGEYLVKYKNQNGINMIYQQAQINSVGMMVMGIHKPGQYVHVNIDKKAEVKTLAQLVSNSNVEWVVPNFKLHAFGTPIEVKQLKEQWAIAKIQAEKAWQKAGNRGHHSVIIGVIDTGIDYRHKNLAANMLAGYDFRDNDSDPMDETSSQNPGHGTHCAGIAAGTGMVDDGIIGAGPDVALMPIRFLGKDGSGDLNAAIRSIDFAIEKGVHVISASWGAAVSRSQAKALIEAVQRADDKGIIFVAAAANDGKSNDKTEVFPANAGTPNMISVAASGSTDAKPSWSNYGKATVHLASPGEKIMSTLPGDKYGELSGTSMATPLVSGVVGFLKSQDPSLTGAQVRALLQTTGTKVSIETACNCRIDQFQAVDYLMSKKMWLVPTAITLPTGGSVNVAVMNGRAPYKFTSSNPSVLTVTDAGAVSAVANGTANISVTDADGKSLTSLDYNVGKAAGTDPGNPGNPGQPGNPGNPGECPLGSPELCDILCGIMPDAPFCSAP